LCIAMVPGGLRRPRHIHCDLVQESQAAGGHMNSKMLCQSVKFAG